MSPQKPPMKLQMQLEQGTAQPGRGDEGDKSGGTGWPQGALGAAGELRDQFRSLSHACLGAQGGSLRNLGMRRRVKPLMMSLLLPVSIRAVQLHRGARAEPQQEMLRGGFPHSRYQLWPQHPGARGKSGTPREAPGWRSCPSSSAGQEVAGAGQGSAEGLCHAPAGWAGGGQQGQEAQSGTGHPVPGTG